ncbi:MAG: hypothetical protein EBX52_12710 [Proteobacteria bacterium]|nr:hypothetical protein [Pseudomonadota bacterium]
MKTKIALCLSLFVSTLASAAVCDVEMAKKYVAGLELVAAGVSNGRIDTGESVNGKTITRSDISAVSADSAYIVTVTNTASSPYSYGNYSKYLVTLKQAGNVCFPASIVFVGNSTNSGK